MQVVPKAENMPQVSSNQKEAQLNEVVNGKAN